MFMEFVECFLFFTHEWVIFPGFGNEHHHRLGQGITGLHQELKYVVETG